MFTRADFSRRFRVICTARVSRLSRSGVFTGGVVTAYLLRWPCGEIAWGSRTQIVWPEHVHIHGYFRVPVVPYLAEEIPR